MIALKPRAPVFFSIACLDIARIASGEKDNLTYVKEEICRKRNGEDQVGSLWKKTLPILKATLI